MCLSFLGIAIINELFLALKYTGILWKSITYEKLGKYSNILSVYWMVGMFGNGIWILLSKRSIYDWWYKST